MCFRKKRTKSKTNQQHQFPISSSEDVRKNSNIFSLKSEHFTISLYSALYRKEVNIA